MTDIQILLGVSISFLLLILAPLIFLFSKGPWSFRTTLPGLGVLVILFFLLYTPLHELSHVAGARLAGIQVRDIQLFPKIQAGQIVTAHYHPANVRSVSQFVMMTGFPYLLDVLGSIAAILFLRRNSSQNYFFAGFLFMVLCLRPAFDFTGETLGLLARNGGDLHQIARSIGFSTTGWILSFSIGITLLSIFIFLKRFDLVPEIRLNRNLR